MKIKIQKIFQKHKLQGDYIYNYIRHWIEGGEKVPSQYTFVGGFFLSRNFLRYNIDI